MTAPVGQSQGGWPPRFFVKAYDAVQLAEDKSLPWLLRRFTGETEQFMMDKTYAESVKKGVNQASEQGVNRVGRKFNLTPERLEAFNSNKGVKFLFNNDSLKRVVKPWIENHKYVQGLMDKADEATKIEKMIQSAGKGAPSSPAFEKILEGGSVLKDGAPAMGYRAMFGFDRVAHLAESGLSRAEVAKEVFNPKNIVANSSKNLLAGETGSTATKEFFRKVVVNQNVQNVVEPLKDGRLLFGGLMTAAWVLMALSALSAGKREYHNSRVQGKGVISSAWEGTKSFLQKSVRSLISWEIAGIGYAIGSTALSILLPGPAKGAKLLLQTIGTVVAGIVSGIGLSMGTDKLVLSKLLPDPPERKQA